MPTFDILTSNKLDYKHQPPVSLPTLTPEEIRLKKVFDQDSIIRVDFGLIATAAQVPE
jgi:hypothetical protein